MSLKEIYSKLIASSRPIEIFGDVTKEVIQKKFRAMGKICHPDILPEDQKDFGGEAMKLLNQMYKKALQEFDEGIYNLTDVRDIYKHSKPSMEFDLSGDTYKFYEYISQDDVGETYKGLLNDDIVYLKIAMNQDDNELIENEFNLLSSFDHQSLPKVLDILKINGLSSIIFSDFKGMPMDEFFKEYGNVTGEHIVWMLERMLSAVGYLHSNNIVHGNIKPGNIYINPDIHNVILLDYSLCIEEANQLASKYRIVNDNYTAPEIDSNTIVLPNADIYSVGKIAIKLLGGDVISSGMPIHIDSRVRELIRSLVNADATRRENDAYRLWDQVIDLRNEVYGKERFLKLEKKYKGGI